MAFSHKNGIAWAAISALNAIAKAAIAAINGVAAEASGNTVTFDAVSAAQDISSTSTSWNHTASGSDRAVFVCLAWGSTAVCTASVTYDGVSMTSVGKATNATFNSGAQGNAEIFVLVNPPTGSKSVVATFSSGSNAGKACSISYTGVNQSTPTSGVVTSTGSLVVYTATVTGGTSLDRIIDCISVDAGGTNVGNQTQRMNTALYGYVGSVQDAAGAASVDMTWGWASGNPYAAIAHVIKHS